MHLPAEIRDAIVEHLRSVLPEEGCGLIGVDPAGTACRAYPVANAERSPIRFTLDPDGHYAALADAEGNGWRLGGVFHSHPRSAPIPSRRDISGALDPQWVHVIVGFGGAEAEVRLWRIRDGAAAEVVVAQ